MVTTVLSWLVWSFVVAYLGDARRIGFGRALFWSLLLSPLVGFAITMASERKGTFEEELARLKGEPKGTPPQAMSPKGEGADLAEQLLKLKGLLDAGAISEEEYGKAKARLLG